MNTIRNYISNRTIINKEFNNYKLKHQILIKNNIDNLLFLMNSPTFACSLGSKELFHSNVWAYLIQQDPIFFTAFKEDNKEKIINIYREHLHMDLIVQTKSFVYVIENKTKSLPNKNQLDKYKTLIEQKYGDNYYLILTGLSEKESIPLPKEWHYLNYSTISDRIIHIIENNRFNCKNIPGFLAFISDYAHMIKSLNSIVALSDYYSNSKKSFFFRRLTSGFSAELWDFISEDLRVGDIFQKLNADYFTNYIDTIIRTGKNYSLLNNDKYESKTGFTNGTSLSEFYYHKSVTDKDNNVIKYFKIGVQIQDSQFRWFIEIIDKKKKYSRDDIFQVGINHGNWFKPIKESKIIDLPFDDPHKNSPKTTGTKKGGKTSFGNFVYQYFKITKNKEAKFRYLEEYILIFLGRAKKINDEFSWDELEKKSSN